MLLFITDHKFSQQNVSNTRFSTCTIVSQITTHIIIILTMILNRPFGNSLKTNPWSSHRPESSNSVVIAFFITVSV